MIRNDCDTKTEAQHGDFDVEIATFQPFAASNGSKHGPTYRVRMEAPSTARREKSEMNFRNNLTAFSWKYSWQANAFSFRHTSHGSLQCHPSLFVELHYGYGFP